MTFSKSKYSYLKHLSKSNTLHFYHHRCELKLVSNVTSSIRFFQESIHGEKDFAFKFCIHIVPELTSFKQYNYFDFFQFLKFYAKHTLTYNPNVGPAFYAYISVVDTETFTTIEKFDDPQGKHKRSLVTRFIFFINPDERIKTLGTRNQLNLYIPKTFGDILKK